jgi:hypothetical protein
VCEVLAALQTSFLIRKGQVETQDVRACTDSWILMKRSLDIVLDKCTKFAVAQVDPEPIMYSINRQLKISRAVEVQALESTHDEYLHTGRYEMPST